MDAIRKCLGKTRQTKRHMKTVLIEMEDILCETSKEAARGMNLPSPENPPISPSGELAETSPKNVEKFFESQPSSFWENLEPTSDLPQIRKLLEGKKVKVITRPYNLVESQEGKKRWLKKHFPNADLVFTRSKHVFANPQTTLIDCRPAAIQAFKRFGGKAVLVPKPWQKNFKPRALNEVISGLNE
jgi:5'(3')-deoxyribonucleotidase